MQLEAGHLGEPEQGREVLADQIVAVALGVAGIDRDCPCELGWVIPVLLIETLAGDAIGITSHEQRPPGEMGE